MKTKQGQVSVQHQSLRSFFAGGSTPAKSLMQKPHTHNACGAKFALASFPNSKTHPQICRRNRKVITPKSTPPPAPHQRFNFLFSVSKLWRNFTIKLAKIVEFALEKNSKFQPISLRNLAQKNSVPPPFFFHGSVQPKCYIKNLTVVCCGILNNLILPNFKKNRQIFLLGSRMQPNM